MGDEVNNPGHYDLGSRKVITVIETGGNRE